VAASTGTACGLNRAASAARSTRRKVRKVVTALASLLLMIKPQFRGIDSLMIKWVSRCKI